MNTKSRQKLTINRGMAGAALAAIAASVCCVGPLVLLGLGIGGAWVGNLTALEPFRPYLIGLTAVFLGFAFYRIYGRKNAEACEPGSYCANPKSDKINKISLWAVTILVAGLLAFPYLIPVLFAGNNETVVLDSHTRVVVLDVPGMTCAACPVTIQKSLVSVDGVLEASVSFEERNAIVKYDPTIVSTKDLLEATRNAGYESTVH